MDHKELDVQVMVGSGVIYRLPALINEFQCKKVFVLADINTDMAAADKVCSILRQAGVQYCKYVIPQEEPAPDEHTVGSVMMHFARSCDLIIGVGSGVINDTGKILSHIAGMPYFIVATAPSMDGYASATSSMERDGLKVSLPSRCADVIIGDTDILKNAPLHMLRAGLGDMLAKYVSICEWRIAHIITGEYYSEEIAGMVRTALKRCVDHADGLMKNDEEAVKAVFEGLIICGQAMAYAGVSRPASGVEHYFSHIWDMRALEFCTKAELHGIQCAVGTLLALKLYEQVKQIKPDAEKAFQYVEAFDYGTWSQELKAFIGKGADAMIALEEKEQKYNVEKHRERFLHIQEHWEDILAVMEEELPESAEVEKLLDRIGAPKGVEEIGVSRESLKTAFQATRDIRDKYVLSRLVWDLGIDVKELSF